MDTRIAGTRVIQDEQGRWVWVCPYCQQVGGQSHTYWGASQNLSKHLNSAKHIDAALASFEKGAY